MKAISNEQMIESLLVGTVLLSPESYPVAADVVKLTDFAIGSAFKVWAALSRLWSVDGNGDLYAKVYLALDSEADKQWFMGVTSDIVPSPSSVRRYAQQVAAAAKMRRIKNDLSALAARAVEPGVQSDWVLEDLLALYRKETGGADGDVSIDAAMGRFNALQEENRLRGHVGLRTGFQCLQDDFIVYQPGHLWAIGAWTSVGKTAFMIEAICRFFLENEHGRMAVFSTEMTEEQNIARILANRTGFNANVILSGNLLDQHLPRVEAEKGWLAGKDLRIYTKTRSIEDISAQCRKLKHGGGVDVVWVDFIQNVHRENGKQDQYAMMSQIAKDLQALAHDCRCTIICLSQLPNHAGREDTGILEFKGAGEIAAACDVGVLMKRAKEDNTKILFDIRKNRHGKCGKILLQYVDGWTRIDEIGRPEGQGV